MQVSLGMVVILIWGYNMVSILDLTSTLNDDTSMGSVSIDSRVFSIPEREEYTYQPNFNDPFRPTFLVPKKKKAVQTRPKPKKPVIPPRLKLSGVIEHTAQLTDQMNKVHFVAKGDTIEGAVVTAVTPDSVVLRFKSKVFTVKF